MRDPQVPEIDVSERERFVMIFEGEPEPGDDRDDYQRMRKL